MKISFSNKGSFYNLRSLINIVLLALSQLDSDSFKDEAKSLIVPLRVSCFDVLNRMKNVEFE